MLRPNNNTLEPKLINAVRSIIYRERGKATLSLVISSLRNLGWTRLGDVDDFAQKCKNAGFQIEHQYKKTDPGTITRTFVKLSEDEEALV